MPVFKCYFQIVKKSLPGIFTYTVIFIAITILLTQTIESGDSPMTNTLRAVEKPITVINRDNSKLGTALKEYLDRIHTMVELPDEKERLQDELFYRNIEYILFVPEGFETSILNGKRDVSLENIKIPDSSSGTYIDMQLDQYLHCINIYLQANLPLEEAIKNANNDVLEKTEVEVLPGSANQFNPFQTFYQFLAYILISILISAMSPVLVVLNRREIMSRIESSSLTLRQKNSQLIFASILFSLICWMVFVVISWILYPGELMSIRGLYSLLNSFIFTIISCSIAFLVGILSKSTLSLNIISNTLGLGMSFFCGIFVPLEVISSSVLAVSKFLPAYWYVTVNNTLSEHDVIGAAERSIIWEGYLIQIGFIAAIIAVALMISRYRKMHPAKAA